MKRRSHKNNKYSKEMKLQAVKDYLNGEGSYETLKEKYKLRSSTQLKNWVMWYNSHKEFKERSSAKGEIYMTKGRKTTQEERAEIVAFCIEHGKDYLAAIEKDGISYQQIDSWVRKYEEMTDMEKLQAENRLLKAQLRDKEVEMLLLKKLQELERGGR